VSDPMMPGDRVGEPALRRTLAPLYQAAYLLVLAVVAAGVVLMAAGVPAGAWVAGIGVFLLLATPVLAALLVGGQAAGGRDRRLLLVVAGLLLILAGQVALQHLITKRVPPGTALRYPSAPRIVAIGDLHGDPAAARATLRLAGAIDARDHWIGGRLVVVQTGDELDRGDGDRELFDWLERLAGEAWRAGGALHLLNGNHEVMNARLDLRYPSERGIAGFADIVPDPTDSLVAALPPERRGRGAAFRPGGPYARILARRNTVVIIGDNIFVHGGVLAAHIDYGLDRMNREVRAWMAGEGPETAYIHQRDSVVWTRRYSDKPDSTAGVELTEVLARLGAKRMIVGHTIQDEGITPRCGDRVWCIDVGLSSYYGGTRPQVLEIRGDQVRILR
jgi:hypothetical protein